MNSFLLKNWKFHYGDLNDGWQKGYDDTHWESVTVPHDWSVHMPFSKEHSSGTGYLAGGLGWYRTSFTLPDELKGKQIYITFDGVYKNAQVWCNSYYLGKRPFGYASFQYDITSMVGFSDTPNVISVKVDHEDIADSRWFTGSGIYRKVEITALEPVHLKHNGLFFTTPSVTEEEAVVQIETPIVNHTDEVVQVIVENRLLRKGETKLLVQEVKEISANSTEVIITNGTIANPDLWSPDCPNLYQLSTKISSHTIESSTSTTYEEEQNTTVGIRSISFTPNEGFFLNGVRTKIKGVCVHHDAGCLGSAVTPEVWLRRLLTLKEMGCNGIRMSHNPHMPELYDLCDRLGFLVMDEAFDEWEGPKNKWSTGHNVYPPKHQGYYEDFVQWHERDLTDMVLGNRNRPSVIMWSVGNEIDYPNDPYCHPLFTSMTGNNDANKPAAERQYNPNKPNAERLSILCNLLCNIVKQSDTTRPVTSAVSFPELSTKIGFLDPLDVVGYNYKEQFYEEDHKLFPDKPFIGSENSHSYSAWKYVRDLEYISGQFLWTGIDYLGEAHGWPIHGSGAGVLTLAGFPKTSYYRRKSFWTKEPFVSIVTGRSSSLSHEWAPMYRSFNYMEGEEIEVRCYTNLSSATLKCNDTLFETKEFDDTAGYISWVIPYTHGVLSVTGHKDGVDQAIDFIEPTNSSCNINLKAWNYKEEFAKKYENLLENISPIAHRLNSYMQIEVTITDTNLRRVTTDTSMLYVEVSGGKLIGLENGDLADVTEYTAHYRRANEGRLLIYVAKEEDSTAPVIVSVRGNGLRTGRIEL